MELSHTQNITTGWACLLDEAQRTKLHEATLRRAIRDGKLRHARVGGRRAIRLKPEWTDEWLMRQSTPIEAV